MSKNIGHAKTHTFNIGDWLSANIYSDMKNGCSCKHRKWSMKPLDELPEHNAPICPACGKRPELYVIVAKVVDADGLEKLVKIRRTQDGDRLTDIIDVIYTLRTVKRELKTSTFDARKYESAESRESYRFCNVVNEYLKHFEKAKARGEITPAGLDDKKSLIKNHLLKNFGDLDIAHISDIRISKFFNSYTSTLRARDKSTAELKTILYFALSAEGGKKLRSMPVFPEIPASKMITPDKFISEEKQDLVISKISNPTYRAAIETLKIYGLRPCDVRTIKWGDVDFKNKILYIRSHMSSREDIPGRKSQAGIVHELPINHEFEKVISSMIRSINPKEYIFKGARGGVIGGNVLGRAWNEACKLAKVKGVKMYWGTKHSTLSRIGKKASDSQLIKLSGHTNVKTIRRYNQSTLDDVRELLS
jgi:integrase